MSIKKATVVILRVLPLVLIVLFIKWVFHHLGWEFISLLPVFTALLGATVFLMGFLLSGVLSDYKESEKIPGELASTLLTLADEVEYILIKSGDSGFAKERYSSIYSIAAGVRKWLYREVKTKELYALIDNLTGEFFLMEKYALPNYIARLKQEQNNLRKIITRIHTIRETDFVFSGYFLARTVTFLLITGLIFLKVEPFYESLFFIGLITYLLIFLIRLIKDLDNPFGYEEKYSIEDVSLKPLDDAIETLNNKLTSLS
jgi:predicted membrane chloride channel (bestrophin family)